MKKRILQAAIVVMVICVIGIFTMKVADKEVTTEELIVVENEAGKEAYDIALEKIMFQQESPDGTWGEDWLYGYNEYAVYDVNLDGKEELLIAHYSSMSDSKMYIYEYDEETQELRKIFKEYLEVTFYENGIIKVLASHNQTENEFWPYTLYCIGEGGRYVGVVWVDNEKEHAEVLEQYIGNAKIIEIEFKELPIIKENVPG